MAFRRVQLWFSNVGLVGLVGLAGLAGLAGLDGLTVVLAVVWVHPTRRQAPVKAGARVRHPDTAAGLAEFSRFSRFSRFGAVASARYGRYGSPHPAIGWICWWPVKFLACYLGSLWVLVVLVVLAGRWCGKSW